MRNALLQANQLSVSKSGLNSLVSYIKLKLHTLTPVFFVFGIVMGILECIAAGLVNTMSVCQEEIRTSSIPERK